MSGEGDMEKCDPEETVVGREKGKGEGEGTRWCCCCCCWDIDREDGMDNDNDNDNNVTLSFFGTRSTRNSDPNLSNNDNNPPHRSRICANMSVPTLARKVLANSTAFKE